jgi:Protein of unknown function (DUF3500)
MSSRANVPNESDDKQSSGTAAARALLQSLPEAERTQAQLSFDSYERTNWNYVPTRRAGVALAELDANQKTLIDPLLRSALSPAGFKTAQQIVQHESILAEIEGNPRRDPGLSTPQSLGSLVRVHLGRGDSKAIIFLSTRPTSTVTLKSWRRSSWVRTLPAFRPVRKPVCDCSRQRKIWLAN